jgi:hypothetical protein
MISASRTPAGVGAGASVLFRAVPNLLLIAGVIVFFTLGPDWSTGLGVRDEQVRDLMPTLAALLSITLALGGFAMKQYSGYQGRRLKFMKDVTETLFFKNIATNLSVLHSLVDAAEEEESKEMILLYYHLLKAAQPLTPAELDKRLEEWLATTAKARVNFDLEHTLQNMQALQGEVRFLPGEAPQWKPLLSLDATGRCHVLPLLQAKQLLDWQWDHAFEYHTRQETSASVVAPA